MKRVYKFGSKEFTTTCVCTLSFSPHEMTGSIRKINTNFNKSGNKLNIQCIACGSCPPPGGFLPILSRGANKHGRRATRLSG